MISNCSISSPESLKTLTDAVAATTNDPDALSEEAMVTVVKLFGAHSSSTTTY